jgi:hypothetical protein
MKKKTVKLYYFQFERIFFDSARGIHVPVVTEVARKTYC